MSAARMPEAGEAGTRGQAERVRSLRMRLGLSQEQLAMRLGVSFVTVNRWEAGRSSISAAALRRLGDLERSGQRRPASPGMPPAPLSSFVGREPEMAALIPALAASRLLSLVGPGGSGKTRLALELARRQPDPGLRVIFVAMDHASDPSLAEARTASALAIRDRPGAPAAESIMAALAEEPSLLMFDGAEHALAGVADLARRVLTQARGTRILITSRHVLGIPGEQVWPVPVMACPHPGAALGDIARSDAVALFAARAAERVPGFAVTDGNAGAVAELCRRLDGLPLAIELAASWMGTLSIAQILDRRLDLLGMTRTATDARTRTLRAVAESSAAMLGPDERAVLGALSVFAGWFTLADAAELAAVPTGELVHRMRRLVESSWLVTRHDGNEVSYRMLDPLAEYAAGRLEASGGAAAARARHLRHFAALAGESEHGLAGAERARWVTRMERATADLEAALTWAQASGEYLTGLRMSGALWRWWLTTGRLAEGRRWLSAFLGQPAMPDQAALAKAWWAAAVLATENGDYRPAIGLGNRALRAASSLRAADLSAKAATVLGSAHRYLGHHAEACSYFELAAERRRELGDQAGLAAALNNVAVTAIDAGDLGRAQRLCEQSLAVKRALGDPRSLIVGLINLSDVLIKTRQDVAAQRVLAEAVELCPGLGDVQMDGLVSCALGDLERGRGEFGKAARHYQRSLECLRAASTVHDIVLALCGLGVCMHHLGQQGKAARLLREAEALALGAGSTNRMPDVRRALAETGQPALAGPPGRLTARQAEILTHVAAGLTNQAIADTLHLSQGTVERHLATVYRKLGLHNRAQATRYALHHGLIPPAATVANPGQWRPDT